jgi:hypothetical protein
MVILPIDPDEAWFAERRDRKIRIRLPGKGRAPATSESEEEFRSLGSHPRSRRRIIVATVNPVSAAQFGRPGMKFMKIPFLLFADETVEDRDDVLLPILDEIMRNAARDYGLPVRRR